MIRFHKPHIVLSPDDYYEIRQIFSSGWVSSGKYCSKLEETLKDKFGVAHAIPCSSATNGLIIAIKAAGWKNKHVFIPAFTWPSTAYAAKCSNLEIEYCDINISTWLAFFEPSPDEYMIAVDVFGNPVATPAYKNNMIIDAAHSYGVDNLGHRALAEVISFSHTKTVTAGEGGAILTNNDELAEIARELVRLSARMEEVNALIALRSIDYYDKVLFELRKKMREMYDNALKETSLWKQKYSIGANPSVYSVCFSNREERDLAAKALEHFSVEYKIYYEPLITGLPYTDEVYSNILCLPMYPEMMDSIEEIANIVVNKEQYQYKNRFL